MCKGKFTLQTLEQVTPKHWGRGFVRGRNRFGYKLKEKQVVMRQTTLRENRGHLATQLFRPHTPSFPNRHCFPILVKSLANTSLENPIVLYPQTAAGTTGTCKLRS